MSSRWYPRYVRGNPQLRVFLPDFWMILKKPNNPMPKNKVLFKIPLQMTKYDVRNYLEKIYKIPVVNVETRAISGELKRAKSKNYIIKDDDYKEAIVDLPKDVQFDYPELHKDHDDSIKNEILSYKKQIDYLKKNEKRKLYEENRHNLPNWFGI